MTELENFQDSIGCNVTTDGIFEKINAGSIPGILVEVTTEEAIACDATPISWNEFVAEFGENIDQMPLYTLDGFKNIEDFYYLTTIYDK